MGIGNKNFCFDKAKNFTSFFKENSIILPQLDTQDVGNILLQKFAFYHLKQCHNTQGFNRELQNLPFSSLSPLTTKHSDRHVLTVATIIDFLYVWKSVAKQL